VIPLPRPVRALAIVCVLALFAACANDPSSAATVGETGEISIDQLHTDVALFGFLTGLSGAPCGTPVGNETQDAACARFALANDIREELAKSYAMENDLEVEAADVKVAYFSPMPPERTGIADYSALLLPSLRERMDVDVVRRGAKRPPRGTDIALYHVGNNPDAHAWIVENAPGLFPNPPRVTEGLVVASATG